MKKYGNPLIMLICGNLLLHLLRTYVTVSMIDEIVAVCTALLLAAFGYTLNTRSSSRIIRKTSSLKKFLVLCLFVALVAYSLGLFEIAAVTNVLNMLGFGRLFMYMMYVYLGFAFAG